MLRGIDYFFFSSFLSPLVPSKECAMPHGIDYSFFTCNATWHGLFLLLFLFFSISPLILQKNVHLLRFEQKPLTSTLKSLPPYLSPLFLIIS
ncbi:Uncharacterized protein TCM_012600 [Theobroma cacao]|uniref:Uncharacterized protein n=1 Tax=Theobroma cacao TaxID=3641 RepID=A0A061G2I0_THECC|nr:Uncharacterized protein TCM_012600 [Theobroma cacao]